MNRLAHAAEDLVGQLREGVRSADRGVVDALLGALDGLRAILAAAAAVDPMQGARIDVPVDGAIRRLRGVGAGTPSAGALAVPDRRPGSAGAGGGGRPDAPRRLRQARYLAEPRRRAGPGARAACTATIASVADAGARARRAGAAGARSRGRLELDDVDRFQRILAELGNDLGGGAGALDTCSAELRQQVMRLRMLPIARVFRKYQRTVRELAAGLGKRARLEIVGDDTELDKLLVEALDDPLMHLVRNAVDHGLEAPDARRAAGKPEEGVVTLVGAPPRQPDPRRDRTTTAPASIRRS